MATVYDITVIPLDMVARVQRASKKLLKHLPEHQVKGGAK